MKAQLSKIPTAVPRRFRDVLQEEIARRCARNPRYSLRAFARALGLDHSTLSKMLRGARPLTERAIRRLGAKLRLDDADVERFVDAEREPPDAWKAGEVRRLTSEAATLLAEWHHYAILELTRLQSFRPDARWIARVLGITTDEVTIALQRLLRLGLLEMRDATHWVDTAGDAVASLDAFSAQAIRGLSDRVRALVDSSQAVPVHYSATTLAVAAGRGGAAVERLERLRRDVVQFLEGGGPADQVYRLEIALFPLTDTERKES